MYHEGNLVMMLWNVQDSIDQDQTTFIHN